MGPALTVSNATVPIRIGDPATNCAGNRFAGTVNLTANSTPTLGSNQVVGASGNANVNVTNGGPGNTVLKDNTICNTELLG